MRRIAIIGLLAISLASCSDRTRVNCERQRNKALGAATVLGQVENNLGAKCE
jgi:hypothetical protein